MKQYLPFLCAVWYISYFLFFLNSTYDLIIDFMSSDWFDVQLDSWTRESDYTSFPPTLQKYQSLGFLMC